MGGVRRLDRRPFVSTVASGLLALAVSGCGTSSSTPAPAASGTTSIASPATAMPSNAVLADSSASAAASATAGPSIAPTPAGTPSSVAEPTTLKPVSISLEAVVGGLPSPIGVSTAPGDPRLFVIGQAGRIVIVRGGKVAGTFLDISARMSCCGERGLLGLAFHPQYASNGRFFVRYTDPAGDLRISEFHVGSNPDAADAASETILLTIPHPTFANHNGGRIVFGPDGYLYIGTGDGGSGGDPNNHGQGLATLLGKMLRIDVDHASGGKPYAIPSTNPFVGRPDALGEIFSYGLRNPYSFSFDRLTGDLWIGDVGQNLWEEVDRAPASTGGGAGIDYGWSVMEGNHCYKPATGCDTAGLTPPLTEYAHGAGDSIGCAIIGGYVYRGTAHPELYGRYFFGDECSGHIWDVGAAGPLTQQPQLLLSSGLNIDGWGEDVNGELYLVASNGTLYQLA
ncbi:MAG: PQQ-dependent sugar dehydrogenase [Candidatus Limnocylindrales bacterium]